MKEKQNILNIIFVAAIIILSVYAVNIQYGIFPETGVEKEKTPIIVKIFVDKNSGTVPLEANFTSIVLHTVGNVKYQWDFGDGETSNEINPTHVYSENGTYTCTLTVTDSSGKKNSDHIEISANANQPPQVRIELSSDKMSRPWKPGTILIWSKLWDWYEGRYIRPLIDKSSIPFMIIKGDSDLTCTARVYDPEGDDIVSYKWELQAPTYSTGIFTGSRQMKPVYTFEGKSITIPLTYIYTVSQQNYIIKLTVQDSAGNNASDSKQFKVEQSPQETVVEGYKQQYKQLQDKWLKKWSKMALGAMVVAGLSKFFPEKPKYPLLVLLIQLYLKLGWNIDLENIAIPEILQQFLLKHPKLLKIVNNSLIKMQDMLEENRGKLPDDFINETIDAIEIIRETLGLANKRPIVSNPVPENGAKNINPECPRVIINVTDPEGDPFNVTISGKYVNNVTYTNQYNGTFNATLITPLPELTDITWHVEVVDPRGKIVREDYNFTTFIKV